MQLAFIMRQHFIQLLQSHARLSLGGQIERFIRTSCALKEIKKDNSVSDLYEQISAQSSSGQGSVAETDRRFKYPDKNETMTHSDWTGWLTKHVNYDTMIDDAIKNRKMNKLRSMQEYSVERRRLLGGELAAARFVVTMNGKVKLYNDDHWYGKLTSKTNPLPTDKTYGLAVEAIDLSGTDLLYEGVENLMQAESLLYLNLSNCQKLDEWAISRLAMIPSLISIDLSDNQYISERCLIPLQHLPNLRRLDLGGIKYFKSQPLALIALEELLPDCVIVNVDLEEEKSEEVND